MIALTWLAFFSPAILLFAIWLRLKAKAAASQSWMTATGYVTSVWPGPNYPEVQYDYSVEGQQYHGKRLWFGEKKALLPSACKGISERYPRGGEILVYYNPEKPKESVLERRVYAPFTLMMAAIWTVVMLAVFILA